MVLRHPELALLLLLLPAFAAVWWRRRLRIAPTALGLRLLILALVVVALTDPVVGARASRPEALLALVIDQSDSLGSAGQLDLRRQAAQVAAAHTGRVEVIYFGANQASFAADQPDAQARGVNQRPPLPMPDPSLRADRTNIAAALDAARALVGPGGGQVALFTDALPNDGDALAAAAALGAANIPIDTYLYVAPDLPEVWLQSIEAPPSLRQGEEFEAQVVVGSTVEELVELRFAVGSDQIDTQQVAVVAGENRFRYSSKAGSPGVLTMRAELQASQDQELRNNIVAATALVAPAPLILLVEGTPAAARPLQTSLQLLSINTDVITPDRLPTRLSELEKYQNVTLLDVSAGDMTLDQMATLREFVRSEGRGLVAAGGKASFTLGSYKDTPLEQVLPVEMTPPKRGERPEIDMLLIIDQSASMGPDTGDSKFNMAKEAAILTSESLRERDRIGVLAFDINQEWIIDFQPIGAALSLAQLQGQISQIPLGGGTDIIAALQTGLPALADQPGTVRHAVLLTDGRSFTNNRQAYESLVEQMQARGVTLSTIAIGTDADTDLLRELARLGTGRYHLAIRPADIPRLTLQESELLRTEPQVEGDFRAEVVTPHATLRGFAADQLPALRGYVATTIKPDAEMVLQSPQEDPVLAAWQYGLGRAVAWTPGVEAPWAADWSNWPEYGRFWAGLIRYTLPEPDSGPLQVRVTQRGDSTTLSADLIGSGGEPLDLADVQVSLTMPDGSERSLALRQIAPGRYAQDVVLPSEGAYALSAQATKGNLVRTGTTGYVRGYPAEYLPAVAGGSILRGEALLQAIADASRPTTAAGQPLGGGAEGSAGFSLWPWLLGLAAVLWPLEVAVRRGWLLF